MIKKNFPLFLAVLCFSFSSCSDDKPDPITDLIEVDYVVELGWNHKDLTINKQDGAVYALTYDQTENDMPLSLKKVSADGSLTILKDLSAVETRSTNFSSLRLGPEWYIGNHLSITSTNKGKLYWTTDRTNYANKILSFSNLFSDIESITVKSASNQSDSKTPNLTCVLAYEDNSLVFFDETTRQLKKHSLDAGIDTFMAGSGNKEIKDGTGADAGFSYITRIVSNKGVLYAIDNSKNIRKIEKQGSSFKVTTLLSNYPNQIIDIAVDNNDNIYAFLYINTHDTTHLDEIDGFYILNKGSNSFEKISNKAISVKTKKGDDSYIAFGNLKSIYINNNDLYLVNGPGRLTKISDFSTKLQQLKNQGLL